MRVNKKEQDRLESILDLEYSYDDIYTQLQKMFDSENFQLREAQFKALAPISYFRRGFFSCGVGHGKTLISLLAPLVARAHRAILLVPSSLVPQLTQIEIPKYEEIFGLKFDWCSIAGASQHKRREMMNKHRITIVPYSLLSSEDTMVLLKESKVDMIIADECQYLKNAKSARTKRLLRFIDEFNPSFVCMSGTIIKRDIKDYWHLIARCLGTLSPLPTEFYDITDIQDTIDPYNHYSKCQSDFFSKLFPKTVVSGNIVDVEKARQSMKVLFDASPGTVRTENQSVDCSMEINVIELEPAKELQNDIKNCSEFWITPDGQDINEAIQQSALLSQIISGFYYKLYWPEGTEQEIIDEYNKQCELAKLIRDFIKYYREGLDTPGLVMKALREGDRRVSSLAREFASIDDWDLPERERETVHLSDYRIKFAQEWARKNIKEGGIIWYKWDASGPELAKALPDATFCPADCPIENIQANGILICSFAHIEGKNIQHHSKNLLFNFPLNAADFEQLMGRTHRQGQEADCVYYDILISSDIQKGQLMNVMKQARYLNSVDKDQKLVIADWVQPEFKKVEKR